METQRSGLHGHRIRSGAEATEGLKDVVGKQEWSRARYFLAS